MSDLLGVRIDSYTKEEANDLVRSFLKDTKQHTIFTPNPEMLVMASRHTQFRTCLNQSDLNICDGFGTHLFSGAPRIPGIDFMLEICALAEEDGKRIYLLGSGDFDTVTKVADEMRRLFPKLEVAGYHPGPSIEVEDPAVPNMCYVAPIEENKTVLTDILTCSPDILFVAFGHGKQEWWISEYLKQLSSVKIAMGVGGAFDMLAEKQKRAPKWLRAIGMEWLWRLIQEPGRWKRIWRAVAVFPVKVLME